MFNDFKEEKEYKEESKKEKKKFMKQLYKIIAVGKNYIVIDNNGNGEKIIGNFENKKSGDAIELDI